MKRMVTKQSTVTPMSTAKGKSMGSGVANMGKGKAMAIGAAAGADMPRIAMKKTVTKMDPYEDMPRLAIKRTVTKKTTKPKAKMLPTVTVTAKKKPMLKISRKAEKIK